jgi:NAD-dependent SIR2 family protein deacetylase
VKQLADKIRSAEHLVVFTGAGVSTSARIPDFRGPKGVWTLKQKGKLPNLEITIEQAMPTKCHMALVELQNQNIMKFLISQNVDGK